jgi:fatty acid synthase
VQLWDVPAGWSLMDAATVPVAYLTCYYALVMRGGLQRGQRVLVHSGTGAVGLAAIRICRFRGCEARACAPLRPPKSARAAL